MKKVFKICILFFLCGNLVILSSCHNMCYNLEKVIGTKGWYERMEWKDTSKMEIDCTGSTNFKGSMQNGEFVIKGTNGSANWNFGIESKKDIKGFSADIKVESGVYNAGIGINAESNFSKYFVRINSKGLITVYYDPSKTDKPNYYIVKDKDFGLKTGDYNNIKMEIQKDRTTKVFVNGKELCTIPDYSLKYGMLRIEITNASSGAAYFKIKGIQH